MRQSFNPRVDVLRVQTVVFQGEEERAGGAPEHVVGGRFGPFPGDGADGLQDGVSFLADVDEDGGGALPGCDGLGFWLRYFCGGVGVAVGGTWGVERCGALCG